MLNKDNKHAYLVMVHKNSYVLETLLKQLDFENNDIYIHVDAKCVDFDWDKYHQLVKKSKIFEVKNRISVFWGHYSQIEAELSLLSAAYNNGHYHFYHLLSGQDLCLKNQEEIHKFFRRNSGKVFVNSINVSTDTNYNFNFSNRIYGRVSVKRIFVKLNIKNR
ncbi:beta-1,6-N-acetylglucosaminyltransferase, partial [Streptococcus orisratti]|uniref:beta-1,6-N-acetylglucosaminyltransferase n=1 Tax=Streptococcus orisratti TaxID=114652 RepID=UPI003D055235